jgi:hypothetical protein
MEKETEVGNKQLGKNHIQRPNTNGAHMKRSVTSGTKYKWKNMVAAQYSN